MEAKQKKCKECGELFKQFNSLVNVCGIECKKAQDEKKREEKQRRAGKILDGVIKYGGEAVKKVEELKKGSDRKLMLLKAQSAFNAYIRERDKKEPCICCGKPLGINYHAGHFFSVGGHSNVRFNEDNAHGQRADCNTTHRAGFLDEYAEGLEERIGAAALEVLRAAAYEPKKWTVQELEKIEKEYKEKLKQLKK